MNDVFAQDKPLLPCKGVDCDYGDLLQLVNNILDFLIMLGFVMAGGVLFYALIILIFKGYQASEIERAKKMLLRAIWGLLLLLSAWLIFEIIFSTLANERITGEIFNN